MPVFPHIFIKDKEKRVRAWVKCPKCNNSLHLVLPGEKSPYWWCQDERQELKPGQEVEVEYLEE